ncbi:MAG: hypothetical protein IJ515_05325 [Clostridia bacterium]|nr:hypothetical protein [Clostridia bacterium]
MEDIERYSDYNEYEDDIPKSKNPILLILKILIAVVCIGVIGIFAFRLVVFNYYPDSMKNLTFNEALTAYYNSTDGEINALTQDLRAPYDDPKVGTFFGDNLIIIEGANQIQCSVRFNRAILEDLEEEYGVELEAGDVNLLSFRLTRNHETEDGVFVPIGTLSHVETDSFIMYEYYKVVFDDVDLLRGKEGEVKWLALEITVAGVEREEPYRIAIYENNDEYSSVEEYKLSEEEHP